MNCPYCGKIMALLHAVDCGMDSGESVFWWVCSARRDSGGCWAAENPEGYIPAPEYDFLWWADGIPQEALDSDPLLKADYEKELKSYQDRPFKKRKYPTGWNDTVYIIRHTEKQ